MREPRSCFFQGAAIALAGFVAGGYISLIVINFFGFEVGQPLWAICAIGGILGAILFFTIFSWALIVISSLSGASFIAQAVALKHDAETLLFFVLVVLGVVIQSVILKKDRRQERKA